MNKNNNGALRGNAQTLRREMTPEEKHLWYDCLRYLPLNVYKQKIIEKYIVDFYIAAAHLVIEVDGAQHYEPEGRKKDAERDAFLQERGLTVVRYTNGEINTRFRDVCTDIEKYVMPYVTAKNTRKEFFRLDKPENDEKAMFG